MFSIARPRSPSTWIIIVCLLAFGIAAARFSNRWLPHVRGLFGSNADADADRGDDQAHDDHDGGDHHDHDHEGHDEANSIHLSEQAKKNIGLELMKVSLESFERTISVPGIIVERPGRSRIEVTAPMTGVISRIYPLQGEAVEPGQPLFDLRLTHEELVQAQGDLLKTVEELDVIAKEVARLSEIAKEGIGGKTLLERTYEQQKQQAALRAQRQALVLHGLSEAQVNAIISTRTLLQTLTVRAPATDAGGASDAERLLQVHDLQVEQGQHVEAGAILASLLGHATLYIEGTAFAQDAQEINQAAAQQWPVSAVLESKGEQPQVIKALDILYVAGTVEPDSRALHFYVNLPNELLRVNATPEGRKFVYWRYKPGQRLQVRVPVEKWDARIVLPLTAVAQDGVESFVFQPHGDHFERVPVHIEHRDPLFAVVANDGSIRPGQQVAATGAHQLQLAIKNQAGGAVDPHAGHSH